MEKPAKKIVIDNNSLVNFFNHYFFDRDHDNKIYQELKAFLLSKIKAGEIIVIDKVFNEFTVIKNQREMKELREFIKPFAVNTTYLADKVEKLRNDYYIPENENFYTDRAGKIDYNIIDRVLDLFLTKHADLYLAAYCRENSDSILVTDESFKKDNKLVEKLPTICTKEKIEFIDLPNSLFNYYKDELNFKLN